MVILLYCKLLHLSKIKVYLFIFHTNLILNFSVSFKDNKATAGGGIYSSSSIIIFDDKCNVSFYNNSVSSNGGAISLSHFKIFFRMNGVVMFTSNSEVTLGGAVLSIGRSSISFEDQATVTFNDNMAQLYGGAVFANKTIVYINGNSTVTFTGNHAAYMEEQYLNLCLNFEVQQLNLVEIMQMIVEEL